jgi:hypothetical protein
MKLWKIAATVAVGVMYSGSGALTVNAATYAYQVDFIDKEVANFDDFRQSFNGDTSNLEPRIEWTFTGNYYFNTCTPTTTVDVDYIVRYRLNSIGDDIVIATVNLPDFFCSTIPVSYTAIATVNLPSIVRDALVNNDSTFVEFSSQLRISRAALVGRTLYLENYGHYFNVFYEFDTTYLFNYFLSDQSFLTLGRSTPGAWVINSTTVNFLEYVYTTAGNDTYLIENSLQVDIGTTRKKYAINVDDVYFRGESVGAQFRTQLVNGIDSFTPTVSGLEIAMGTRYAYHFLNVSNYQQPIENVPDFDYEYEDCGWDAFNIPCFINNGIAYIVNDAPVISDAFTLLNAGMKLGGQAFGIIGQFTDNNLFGVLILGGMGITAVRWFLKND